MIERQEIHCHNCGKYVQFDIDLELDGNHVLKCPECDHEHCRVVKDGIITEERWDSRNGVGNVFVTNITITLTCTQNNYISVTPTTTFSIPVAYQGTNFLSNAWLQTQVIN
jgi:DNA-directed RNA polymerase subunit RPC12/RpoP